MQTTSFRIAASLLLAVTIAGVSASNDDAVRDDRSPRSSGRFEIVVVPDTQNLVDFRHQTAQGFAIDSRKIFIDQMKYIADQGFSKDGTVAFVTSVGDVWQHQTIAIDPGHAARGFSVFEAPELAGAIEITSETLTTEIPTAIDGYRLIDAADIPFGIVPGNHDYDAVWFESLTSVHVGGLSNFVKAFGEHSEFFKNKNWYIGSVGGGSSSAQMFSAAGDRFLHFSFEMQPSDRVLAWATELIKLHPGLPTIISTHDFLNPAGERSPAPILDLARSDPDAHNSAEQMWQKFIRKHDQIFLVLSGHHIGQSRRIDLNDHGHQVIQLLANFQARGQAAIDAGQALDEGGAPVGVGDGWYRVMEFDLRATVPRIRVRTYSSHYRCYSSEMARYAQLYKRYEQPEMTDAEFYAADEFSVFLTDFHRRFTADPTPRTSSESTVPPRWPGRPAEAR